MYLHSTYYLFVLPWTVDQCFMLTIFSSFSQFLLIGNIFFLLSRLIFSLCSYQSTLKQLFQEFDDGDPDDQLATVTTRIMLALINNLDGKSKQYKDPALTQLFLMNNIHYIVRSVRRFVTDSHMNIYIYISSAW